MILFTSLEVDYTKQRWECMGIFLLCIWLLISKSARQPETLQNTFNGVDSNAPSLKSYPLSPSSSSSFISLHRKLSEEDNQRNMDVSDSKNLELEERIAESAVHLFTPADFTVVGSTVFPKPTDLFDEAVISLLKPTYGAHRSDKDAVFVLAAEYGLDTYLTFVESLRSTGFDGDIVFAVSILDMSSEGVKEYLTTTSNIVTYVLEFQCFNAEMEETSSSKGGMRVCQLHHLYSDLNGRVLKDPREPRTIPTTRYELYWQWSLQYQPNVWFLLLDARDSYFQLNPFANLPRIGNSQKTNGKLYFFGENANATRIGQSLKNRKWLSTAYGDVVADALQDKPTICSGSTMGEQVAVETYLRAMVSESDETGTKLMGADQGFHNYLYYTNKLANAKAIHSISVFDQGRGIINNLGAMRTAPLESWGNGKILDLRSEVNMTVLNWDGSISPIIHQFDRHKVLSKFVYKHETERFRVIYNSRERN